ncbi:MAG: vitamin B12-dependent ribonucleotide reductase [Phycisphaerae bacterium]|nr:vitamin B12-dependent ribonucleotide reductase [Phycisphaerae bacterium]
MASSKDKHAAASGETVRSANSGLTISQVFSTPDVDPFSQVTWDKRSAKITDDKGKLIFEQKDVDVPADWSQLATNVVVSKYFWGEHGQSEREHSVQQLVYRVTRTIADWGKADGLFATDADAERFYNELTYLCVNQYGAFNSPVWFNVGLFHQYKQGGSEGNFHWDAKDNKAARTLKNYEYPQGSACFIQGVDDTMEDIMRLATAEAMLFKYGSGTGSDLSTLRSSREKLSGGGRPSGPLSFMRIFDQIAAVVRSGGKTRRAAKMQSLKVSHPDIKEFITCKMDEEKKAWALIEQGYDSSINGDAYGSVMFQNANLSVRLTDDFMQAALADKDWTTRAVTSGEPMDTYKAKELLEMISEGTRVCGDPGVQYHTTINTWHTCPASGEINASNPCSEYMFINDSACNLSSLNLMKFRRADGSFDVESFRAAVRIFIIAQEILVDHGSYPSERICRNSHEFRPLGLGYANLGCLVMSLGLPYDSDGGRAMAGAITSIMTGAAYATSAELASRVGPFTQYQKNRRPMLNVIRKHRDAVANIDAALCPATLLQAARDAWTEALAAGEEHGYRNAQVSVLAPTGTIGFMMDCDTTGVEPDIALVKYKQLAGGGMFKMVNQTVPMALDRLGYSRPQVAEIETYIDKHDMIEGAPHLADEHLPVFDCAFRPAKGKRSIHYMGHIRMMAAVQPFLSGAISKTVNMPKESTTDEIMRVYTDAWKLGIKAVAIYRDGSKAAQPVSTKKDKDAKAVSKPAPAVAAPAAELAIREPERRRMPVTAGSIRHKFDVAGHEGYLHVGLQEDSSPGELFVTMAKEGSTVGGMMDAFATAISLCLQYGVPLEALVKKFSHQRFDPQGMTRNPDIPFAKSIVDYIFRWLGLTFLEEFRKANLPGRAGTSPKASDVVRSLLTQVDAAPEDVTDDSVSSDFSRTEPSDTDDQGPSGAYSPATRLEGLGGAKPKKETTWLNQLVVGQDDAPACDVCGAITVRNGACYKCLNCGTSAGCS